MRLGQKRPTLSPLTTKQNRKLLIGMSKDERLTLLVKILRRLRAATMMSRKSHQHCMTCGEPLGGRRHRGCCSTCYEAHKHAVRCNRATWEQIEAEGLIGPGRPRKPK